MAFTTKINKALITGGYDKHGPGMNAPGTKGYAKWEAKEKARKANEGIGVKPYTPPAETGSKGMDWINNLPGTTPRKSTGESLAASGSDKRAAQYKARNWKNDDTIKGFNRDGSSTAPKPRKKVEAVKAIKGAGHSIKSEPTGKVDIKKKPIVPKAKQSADTVRKNKSISKKQAKADEARASGNTKKADRKERSIARKKSRMANK
jgi:hypothetical protein